MVLFYLLPVKVVNLASPRLEFARLPARLPEFPDCDVLQLLSPT